MGIGQRLNWMVATLVVFIIVLSTNLIDRRNFLRIKDTVDKIYDDRLVANDLLSKMAFIVHEKEIALFTKEYSFFQSEKNSRLNRSLDSLFQAYESTDLTAEESQLFADLKSSNERLLQMESSFGLDSLAKENQALKHTTAIIDRIGALLDIQIAEGNRQRQISKKAFASINLFTQIEIYLLAALALAFLILVSIKSRKVIKEKKQA